MSSSPNTPKKRGRKPKVVSTDVVVPKPPPKKRGRKPKGGQIVTNNVPIPASDNTIISNIIVHLKCHMKDLDDNQFLNTNEYMPNIESVECYDEFLNTESSQPCEIINSSPVNQTQVNSDSASQSSIRLNLANQITKLQHDLNISNYTKQSACFWCTETFKNDPVFIPSCKSNTNGKYSVYGNFCSPECACAYLMKENIGDTEKFERYHLLNYIYGEIYNYGHNFKPAPDPHFTLKKFMGNMSIEDYRELYNYDKCLLVVNKPMVRVLPQLFDDNSNYQINQKNNKINSFNLSKTTDKTDFFNLN
tara:strand:+ start:6138 stop:7052 length:915 start_codon:yes stop_codon:yes gene_type:complete